MCTIRTRSEEHTSELQSRLHLVCRLLLGKTGGVVFEEILDPEIDADSLAAIGRKPGRNRRNGASGPVAAMPGQSSDPPSTFFFKRPAPPRATPLSPPRAPSD